MLTCQHDQNPRQMLQHAQGKTVQWQEKTRNLGIATGSYHTGTLLQIAPTICTVVILERSNQCKTEHPLGHQNPVTAETCRPLKQTGGSHAYPNFSCD